MAEPQSTQAVLAQVLREIRARKGWSQMRLSSESGVHLSHLSAAEQGRRNLSLDVIVRIAHGAGITMADFGALYDRAANASSGPGSPPA